MTKTTRAVLCNNCPFKRSSPKAGEPGGSVPARDARGTSRLVTEMMHGCSVMQCHKSSDDKPRACAGYLSVVGSSAIGVRVAVVIGAVHAEDVDKPIAGLYKSLVEMIREADHMNIEDT